VPEKTRELTARQGEILAFIQERVAASGMPPTLAEIARAIGVKSSNGIRDHLAALARKGVIERIPSASRGIRLTAPFQPVAEDGALILPVVGRVAAGTPILAQQHIESHYPVDRGLFKPTPDYLLTVQGMSMRDAGILPGDLLAVHRCQQGENGQIVVARLEDEVTVKRFRRTDHQVMLEAANPDFEPIRIDLRQQSLTIEGRVVGLLRRF